MSDTATVSLDLVRERTGGNYRAMSDEKVREYAGVFATEGYRPEVCGRPEVRPMPDGSYTIVSGHHRIAAAKLVGWDTLDVAVAPATMTDQELLIAQVNENGRHLAPTAVAEASAYGELAASGMTAEEIAQATGRRTDYVARRLAVLALDTSVRAIVDRYGFRWADGLADLPHAAQREAYRVLEAQAMTYPQWSAYLGVAREKAHAQDGMFDAESFTLFTEEWDSVKGAYLTETPAGGEEVVTREQVVGKPEVAALLGVALPTVYQWQQRKVLPPADMTVSGAPAWYQSTILEWARATKRL